MSSQPAAVPSLRRYSAADSAIQTEIGKKSEDFIRLDGGPGYGLFGPHITLDAGTCIARIFIDGPAQGCVAVDIAAEYGKLQFDHRRLDLGALDGPVIELRATFPRPMVGCEVRLFCESAVHADIRAVEIGTTIPATFGNDPDLDDRLQHFTTRIAPHVQGWLGDRMYQIVKVFGSIFREHRVGGNIAEIGVHHGLSFFLFNTLRRENELSFAIDIFDDQHLNIDSSGMGSRSLFTSHLASLLPQERPFVRVLDRDSTTFSLQEFSTIFAPAGVKMFSVDGGHTAAHVCNDLVLVQEVLVPGGIVAVDDFFGPHWPDVTAGFYQFMATRNRRLSPILFFQNKLFLTTISQHDLWLDHLRTGLLAVTGEDEFRTGRWKYVEIAGAKLLAYG